MPFIDQIADRLAGQMIGNRVAGKSVLGEQGPFLVDVIRFRQGAIHLEMIAPAGEFHAVVTHFFDLGRQVREGKISPLTGEQSDRT